MSPSPDVPKPIFVTLTLVPPSGAVLRVGAAIIAMAHSRQRPEARLLARPRRLWRGNAGMLGIYQSFTANRCPRRTFKEFETHCVHFTYVRGPVGRGPEAMVSCFGRYENPGFRDPLPKRGRRRSDGPRALAIP